MRKAALSLILSLVFVGISSAESKYESYEPWSDAEIKKANTFIAKSHKNISYSISEKDYKKIGELLIVNVFSEPSAPYRQFLYSKIGLTVMLSPSNGRIKNLEKIINIKIPIYSNNSKSNKLLMIFDKSIFFAEMTKGF